MAWTAFAPAPRAMSSIISSSIRWSFTGGESDCTMNTSRERTLAPSWMYRLSLLNLVTATPSSGTPSSWAMSAASGPFELPAKKRTSLGSIISAIMVGGRYQKSNIIGRWISSMAESPTPAIADTSARRPPLIGALAAHVGARRAAWLVAGGLAVVVASAWFNRGFLSYDEHFQILEFAWYKLGRAPAETLAWEFREQMRPGLQPLMAAWAARGVEAFGVRSPFMLAFLLRLVSGLLGVWVSLAVAVRVLPEIRSERLKVALVAGSLFLWFLPFAHVRFSADNWGGILFFAGLCLLMDSVGGAGARDRATAARDSRHWPPGPMAATAAAGLLWGLAFYFRYQIGFSIAGAGCWLLFVRRARPAVLAVVALSFLIACGACALADRWLYDAWVFTPLRVRPGEPDRGQGRRLRGGAVVVLRRPDAAVPPSPVQHRADRPARGRRLVRPAARPGVGDGAVPGRATA